MSGGSINIDLDDPRIGKIATAISNKTCKKILKLLVNEELSEADIAKNLSLPINTIEYNLKKLVEARIIEKSRNYFWSVKGKKIPVYIISNKKIIISPKKMIKGVVPAVIVSGIVALILRASFAGRKTVDSSLDFEATGVSAPAALKDVGESVGNAISGDVNLWAWFLAGALFSLIMYFIWNWLVGRKTSRKFEV